jgi:hypothetical protein
MDARAIVGFVSQACPQTDFDAILTATSDLHHRKTDLRLQAMRITSERQQPPWSA